MRLTVATNFDDRLIEQLEGYPVVELFGKLPRDFVGGGMASYMLSPLSRRRLEGHVGEARRRGMLRPPPEQGVFIDNRKLDGFLALFPQERCATKDCAACRYCFEWAARVVQIDASYRRECLALYREVLEDLCGGGRRQEGLSA